MDNYLNNTSIQEFDILLQKFENIPRMVEPPPTIMEIAGFPHYENVCSNILAYYFNTDNPHGLKNLLLKSLLDCAYPELSGIIQDTTRVGREEPTNNLKRIDITIETEEAVLVIENKIYARLYNDLNDYSDHVKSIYNGKFHKLKIVLSLFETIKAPHSSGFVNVTYKAFISCIKANIGNFMLSADTKATMFLLDFLQTIQNLTKPDTMNSEIIDFFTKNNIAIQNLIAQNDQIKNHLAGKLNDLKPILLPRPANVKQWVYQRHNLVHDFTFGDIMIAVDCIFYIDGVEILVWVRKGENSFRHLSSISTYINDNYSQADFFNNRLYVVKKSELPLLTPNDEIKDRLDFILNIMSMMKAETNV